RGAAEYLGDVRLQVNGDAEFGVGTVKLPALALGKIIVSLHCWVSSYSRVSGLFAFRAEMMRIRHSSAETSKNVWIRIRTLPRRSFPMLTHRSSSSLCSSSGMETVSGSKIISAARSKLILCFF